VLLLKKTGRRLYVYLFRALIIFNRNNLVVTINVKNSGLLAC
jgi:hypothetical protein